MITIALPSRGRLAEPSEELLSKLGIDLSRPARSLICRTEDICVVFVHPKDAGRLIDAGVIDLAISAQDIQAEYPANVDELLPLHFAECQIVLATRNDSSIMRLEDCENKTIATSYPNLTKSWFAEKGIFVNVLTLHGAVEIAPWLGVAEAIVDSYQTGVSAKANGLRLVTTLLESEAVLIGNPKNRQNGMIENFISLFEKPVYGNG